MRKAVLATAAWAVVATGIGATYAVTGRNDVLDDQRTSVREVLALLPAGARIASVEAPQPLVLTHQRNLSRFQQFGNGLIDYLDDYWPGGRDGYGRYIARRHPTLIALGNHGVVPSWLAPTLEHGYWRVATGIGWDWYVSRDVGREKLHALRQVVRDTYVPVPS